MKRRVLYVLDRYPQLSETYIKTEIEAVCGDYDLRVISLNRADVPYRNHLPFEHITRRERMGEIIAEFRPDVLHAHYVTSLPWLTPMASRFRLPYTLRAHSFDAIPLRKSLPTNEYCLGILAFPFTRPSLEAAGIPGDKIIDCHPVVDYARFHDPSPNGDAILNVGPCLPKKRFEDFVDLANRMPGRRYDLYPVGYASAQLMQYNAEHGSPVTIHPAVQPEEMPSVFKSHGWLVYTACTELRTVGWPVSVAEAQAAGVGICMPRLRPDVAEYVGEAGFLYERIEELLPILGQPYPAEMRARGFEQARKSDVAQHKAKLTSLWDAGGLPARPPPSREQPES